MGWKTPASPETRSLIKLQYHQPTDMDAKRYLPISPLWVFLLVFTKTDPWLVSLRFGAYDPNVNCLKSYHQTEKTPKRRRRQRQFRLNFKISGICEVLGIRSRETVEHRNLIVFDHCTRLLMKNVEDVWKKICIKNNPFLLFFNQKLR